MKKVMAAGLILAGAVLVLCSCSTYTSVSKKLHTQTKANISIFADQTISMLSESDFGFTRNQSLYTREFLDPNGEEEMALISTRIEAHDFFRRIVRYSLGLVLIVESKKTEAERVEAYHDFISNMNTEMLIKLDLEPDHYDDIKLQVAGSETFLAALRAAQPIINASGRYMHQVLDRSQIALDTLIDKVDGRIDEEYAAVIHYQERLEEEKYNILESFAYLYGAYKGNMEAYALLSEAESIHRADLIADPPPSDQDLEKISKFLKNRLSGLHLIENEISIDWETYRAAHREGDNLHEKASRGYNRARLITLVWLRAHQKMASGVASPAEWFDVKSLPSTLINAGVKAAF